MAVQKIGARATTVALMRGDFFLRGKDSIRTLDFSEINWVVSLALHKRPVSPAYLPLARA
jgi:hypothetical protein